MAEKHFDLLKRVIFANPKVLKHISFDGGTAGNDQFPAVTSSMSIPKEMVKGSVPAVFQPLLPYISLDTNKLLRSLLKGKLASISLNSVEDLIKTDSEI